MAKEEPIITPLFATPLMSVQLDLDTDKLTELAFEMQHKDKKGKEISNKGGWHSDIIHEEKHEEVIKHKEFIKLNKKINQYLQKYHSEVFRGMIWKDNLKHRLESQEMWVNINEKHHYNEWHNHSNSTLSGTYYIKHDGSIENGIIVFKHPVFQFPFIMKTHWPNKELIERYNEVTSEIIDFLPQSNMLLIFPSWLEHKVETNLKDDTRISLSFNTIPILEKKSK